MRHLPADSDVLLRFLRRTLARLRGATLAALLILVLVPSTQGTADVSVWVLVLIFAGYELAAAQVRGRLTTRRALVAMCLIDLPVAGVLYFLAGRPGGPLIVLFFLAVGSAASYMTLRGTLRYTTAAAAAMSAAELVLRRGSPSLEDLQSLGVRLVLLALAALGMAVVTLRLAFERETTEAVRDEAERLGVLDRLRADFFATISHDLRTPLTAASASLGLLQAGVGERLRSDEQDLLANARRNTERLGWLIDDLIAFNQLEAGTLRLDRESLDLRTVAVGAVEAVAPLLREKGQRLEVDLPEPLPVEGDPRRLEQVVVNLLANAHRHTPAGTLVTVSGRSGDDEIALAVRDHGPGIPAAEQAAVFRRFYRLIPAAAGSGLGLAIARGLVELHGGRIELRSEVGHGAIFRVILPRRTGGPD